MDLKRLLMLKGLKQVEIAKKIGVRAGLLNLQMNKHQLLPKKYQKKFCDILGITVEQLHRSMKD